MYITTALQFKLFCLAFYKLYWGKLSIHPHAAENSILYGMATDLTSTTQVMGIFLMLPAVNVNSQICSDLFRFWIEYEIRSAAVNRHCSNSFVSW